MQIIKEIVDKGIKASACNDAQLNIHKRTAQLFQQIELLSTQSLNVKLW